MTIDSMSIPGPNNELNRPDLTSVATEGDNTVIEGTLMAAPDGEHASDSYENSSRQPFAEGRACGSPSWLDGR